MLWILGDMVGLPFLAAQLIQMIREDEQEASVVDAELDAKDAAAALTPPGGADDGAHEQPWWEADPRFAARFRSVDGPGQQ